MVGLQDTLEGEVIVGRFAETADVCPPLFCGTLSTFIGPELLQWLEDRKAALDDTEGAVFTVCS